MSTTNSMRAAAVVVALVSGAFVAMSRPSTRDEATPAISATAPVAERSRPETAERRRGVEPKVEAPAAAVATPAVDAPAGIPPSRPSSKPATLNDNVGLGLRWLKGRQSKDGSWHDPATTGVALLAFLAAGETPQFGTCRESVKSGLQHLAEIQDVDGRLAPRDSVRALRDHAVAGLALCEAYGMTGSRKLKEPAQRAVAFAMKTRTPSSGWSRPDGRLEFETTVWMSMLVKSAKLSGLDVDDAALSDVVRALDQVTDHETGRVDPNDDAISTETATAMAMLVRFLARRTPDDDEMLRKGVDVVVAKPPTRGPESPPDFAAWYFGTLAVWDAGPDERWPPWARTLQAAVAGAQRTDAGDAERGSFDPRGASATEADRVWATAFSTLSVSPITSNWYPRLKPR
jgi:hypothetical protein